MDEHAVIKTLVMEDDRAQPMLVLMHGDQEVSTRQLARQTERKSVKPCDPATAQRHTGYLVGGTSPFGTLKKLPVFIERSILELDAIYLNGGRRGLLVRIAPTNVVRLSAHDLLARTVFYKVGHHCSHNATLKKGGLELMQHDDLVAFIPLDKTTAKAQGKKDANGVPKGWDMPAGPLFKALNERAKQRVVISDVKEALTSAATKAGVVATETYIDYFLK